MSERVTAFFVIDGPDMAAQGLLLASSLRARVVHDLDIVAYAPEPGNGAIPDDLRAAYDRLGARVETIAIPADTWKKPFPHGNKIFACLAPRDGDTGVFFDTDMLIGGDLDLRGLAPEGGIAAVPEGKPTWGKTNERWPRAYAHFGMEVPTERVRLTRGRRIEFYPYYNAGFLAFREGAPPAFARRWFDTARDIDWNLAIAQKRPWLDQIALPLTCARFGIPVNVLDERYNYSISDRAFEPNEAAVIHYHRFAHNHGWPFFAPAFDRLVADLGGQLPHAAAPLREGLEQPAHG
ncbi:hypothetical protein SAMN04488012_104124 [Palleronia salina]|uniref:Glycosyl transferase family 8 n=1 Tax=Palleronia salina TaxID=313368 RepID=A0A1M6FY93_9RHOB|nr:hypothetical protein [Palleronia salina]SHJ02728.1 hypothetical protein SAMN04488012_104124 [Palleronia salina]